MSALNLKGKIISLFKEPKTRYPILVFIFFFLYCLLGQILNGPLNLYPEGGDSSFYAQIGVWYSKIFSDLPHFIGGVISNSLSPAEYASYGMVADNPISTFFRSPVYGFWLGLFIFLFGLSNGSLLFSQAILTGLLGLFIFIIVRRSAGLGASWIAMIFLALHFSVLTVSNNVLTELFLSVFLLFLTLVVLNTFKEEEELSKNKIGRRFFYIGFLILLVILTKPSMQYYIIFFLAGIMAMLYLKKTSFSTARKSVIFFLVGFLLTTFLWGLFFQRATGHFDITTRGLEGTNLLLGTSVMTEGQGLNSLFVPLEFRDKVRNLTSIPNAWYQYYSNLALKAGIEHIKAHPFDMILLFVKKSSLTIMIPPYNINSDQYFPEYRKNVLPIIHFALFILFLSGLFFLKKFYVIRIMSASLLIYLFLIHAAGVMDDRYFFPLLPFLIIISSIVISQIKNIRIPQLKILPSTLILILNILVLFLSRQELLGVLLPTIESMKIVQAFLRIPLLLFDGYIVIRVLTPLYAKQQLYLIGFLFISLITIYSFFLLTNPTWGYWKTVISKDTHVRKDIILPPTMDLSQYEEAFLIVNVDYEKDIQLSTRINTRTFSTTFSGTNSYPIIYSHAARWKKGEAQWLFTPIPFSSLKTTNIIEIKTSGENFRLTGNFNTKKSILPSFIYYRIFSYQRELTAKEKRAYHFTPILSQNSTSYLFRENMPISDFSLSPLKQTGNMHIFIVLKRKGNYYVRKEYVSIQNSHPKFILLLNIIDRGIVKWLPAPDKDYTEVASDKVLNVILSEHDRFYSGYELY